MLYYKLDKEVSAEKIIQDIQKLVSKTPDSSSKVLTICIRDITDYTSDNPIPKITYNPDCTT
jgi:hypothetical protein